MLLKTLFVLAIPCVIFASCTPTKKSSAPVYTDGCADSLIGAYISSDICATSGTGSSTANIVANTSSNITISYLYGVPVTAQVDCSKNALTIPAQTFSGSVTISGTGSFTRNTIIINWNANFAGTPISCTTTYTR